MGSWKNCSVCAWLGGGEALTWGNHPRFTLWEPGWARERMLQHHPSYKGCGVTHHGDKQRVFLECEFEMWSLVRFSVDTEEFLGLQKPP